MLVRNAVSRCTLPAGSASAKAYRIQSLILFNRLFYDNAGRFFSTRRLGVHHTGDLNSRRIHHSVIRSATPLSHIPEPSINPTAPVTSRDAQVSREIKALWYHVVQLMKQEKWEMAIALIRERLKDPFAHLPSPVTATVDELRVPGHHFLGLSLNVMHFSGLSDLEEEEMLDALRRASEALSRYRYENNKEQIAVVLEILSSHLSRREEVKEIIPVYERLVWVLRDMVKDQPSISPVAPAPPDKTKGPQERQIVSLQNLASAYMQVFQSAAAVRVIEEAYNLFLELKQHKWTDPNTPITLLCFKAQFMVLAGIDGSGVYMKEAWEMIQERIRLYSEENGCRIEEVVSQTNEIRPFWVMAALQLDDSLTDAEWSEVFPIGETRKEILMTANEHGLALSKLPSNLRDSLPDDFERLTCFFHLATLISLAPRLGSLEEEVLALERAFEVVLIQTSTTTPDFLKAPNRLPASLSHVEFVKLFDWNALNYTSACHACSVLPKLGIARLNLVRQLECDSQESDGTVSSNKFYRENMDGLAEEIGFGLRLVSKHIKCPPTEEARKALQTAKGQLLVLKGRMLARGSGDTASLRLDGKEYWEEARRVLKSVEGIQTNGMDLLEKERLEELKTVDDLLKGVKDP